MNKKFLSAVLFVKTMMMTLTASTRNWSISSQLFQLYRQKLMLVSMLPT